MSTTTWSAPASLAAGALASEEMYAADDVAAAQLDDLGQQQSQAPGGRVDERGVSGLHRVEVGREVACGEALHHHRSGHAVVDRVGGDRAAEPLRDCKVVGTTGRFRQPELRMLASTSIVRDCVARSPVGNAVNSVAPMSANRRSPAATSSSSPNTQKSVTLSTPSRSSTAR